MMTDQMRSDILNTLENRDELIDETATMDSSSYTRYVYKIKSWEAERLKRSLTAYKLQNLQLDFLLEEEKRTNIIKLISNTEPIIQYFKNLLYPLYAHVFFKIDDNHTANQIEELLENPINGISKKVPEPNKIKNSNYWYKTTLKIDDEKEFSSKINLLKQQNPNIELFANFEYPTVKTYAWIFTAIAALVSRYIYDLLIGFK